MPSENTMHVPFPVGLTSEDVAALVSRADAVGAASTAVWLEADEQLARLSDFGFESGWQPWWMVVAPSRVRTVPTPRVRFAVRVRDHDRGRAQLVGRPDVFLAEATVDGRYAGRAWLHVVEGVAGISDTEVWPALRRRGVGRKLVSLLAAEAAHVGARVITLNATPEGAHL